MRAVAVLFALVSFVATLPTSEAVDECANPGAVASYCKEIPLQPQSPISGVGIPPTPLWGKYYLWIGAGHCTSPTSDACRSIPGENNGVPTPVGYVAGPHIISVLFRESNGVGGLQRSSSSAGGRSPDATVLM